MFVVVPCVNCCFQHCCMCLVVWLLLPQSCQDVDQNNNVWFSVSGATLGFEGSDSQISTVNEVGVMLVVGVMDCLEVS